MQAVNSYFRDFVKVLQRARCILLNLQNLFTLLAPRGTSKKLSEATGISTGNISDWKSGRSKPTADALILVADYFDCSVDYLLGRTDKPEVNR